MRKSKGQIRREAKRRALDQLSEARNKAKLGKGNAPPLPSDCPDCDIHVSPEEFKAVADRLGFWQTPDGKWRSPDPAKHPRFAAFLDRMLAEKAGRHE